MALVLHLGCGKLLTGDIGHFWEYFSPFRLERFNTSGRLIQPLVLH